MAKSSESVYALAVRISESDVNAIAAAAPGAGQPLDKVGAVAGGLLRDLARGGIMIPSEWASRVEAALGNVDAQAIVAAVEKAVNRQGEATVVPWVVDPTHIQWYQHLADNVPPNGISLELQLKSIMDYAYSQGYFGQNAPEPYKILLDYQQWQALQQMAGKDIPTGVDVMALLTGTRRPESADEFDVLDALKEAEA